MPKWLQGMMAPTLMLWLYAVAYGIASGLGNNLELTWRADTMATAALSLILSFWVMTDAHKRGRQLWYDYGSFVFFAPLAILPFYLFQTRGVRAFLTLLCFAGIWLIGLVVGSAVMAIRMMASAL